MNVDTLIIGGGASGMMAGCFSADSGRSTMIIEKNSKVGRKLYITGKGRCNLTNNCDVKTVITNTPTNGRFLYSCLTNFTPHDVMEFFEKRGLPLKTERGNRVFPVSDRAADVIDTLKSAVLKSGCRIKTGEAIRILIQNDTVFGAELSDGSVVECRKLIIASGGCSYPLTGSTGDGYRFAEAAGHTIVPLRASLVPLVTAEHFGYDADGLLLKNIGIKLRDNKKNKIIYTDFGEAELKRWGLSGAVVRSASAHIREMESGRYQIEIDLKPALSDEKLDARLVRELSAAQGNEFSVVMRTLLPAALIKDFSRIVDIPLEKKCSEITKTERQLIVDRLKRLTRTITDFRPVEEAIVTSGGVSVKEIDPKTMASKIIKGLYFAGEVIDYDCYTGGFNLQAAFSTGHCAGLS